MRKQVDYPVLVLLALLLAGMLCACGGGQQAKETMPEESAVTSAAASVEEAPEDETQYIAYPCFVNQAFTSEHHTLTMENPAENPVSFTFTVSYKGETLYASDPVAPGESTEWDIMEQWSEKGHHTITVTSVPVLADGSAGNPSAQVIRVTLNFD